MPSPAHSDIAPPREPLPRRLCNLDRLLHAMAARNLDGIVATTPQNVCYLSGFNAIAHKSDEPRPYAVLLSRHAPEHPVMVVADYYLATFLVQPSWVEDLRPFRAVMMPLDLPAARTDIERFIPASGARTAVMCSESVWWRCHRRLVADVAVLLHGVQVTHLLPGGRSVSHELSAGARVVGSTVFWDRT